MTQANIPDVAIYQKAAAVLRQFRDESRALVQTSEGTERAQSDQFVDGVELALMYVECVVALSKPAHRQEDYVRAAQGLQATLQNEYEGYLFFARERKGEEQAITALRSYRVADGLRTAIDKIKFDAGGVPQP